jgi:hypothetical protein
MEREKISTTVHLRISENWPKLVKSECIARKVLAGPFEATASTSQICARFAV